MTQKRLQYHISFEQKLFRIFIFKSRNNKNILLHQQKIDYEFLKFHQSHFEFQYFTF